ncbi:beta-galactosidase [Cellulomonas marina]|uniref:beta-galactosidase n=1 Tax=Cellulomonas marina TaxID=988821 RepID=A0A1I1AHC0_9CELL|nr:beta-galactosidase [Cellulomonas marina]GIG30781.1 beta-galactosidase [Cellulomonas marina]SFB37411.1 beta-galactosidase [Cellulomonas marina]
MGALRHVQDRVLFGAAYYDEYLPTDRIATDMAMMRDAHLNVIRIAESTWSTLEPQPGVFDLGHVDRALDAAEEAGLSVIVGTPTYAVPAWLVASHPEVLAVTDRIDTPRYGARQIMDITHPAFRFHAERVIRLLVWHVAQRGHVIGFQLDNETKHYDAASRGVQRGFVKHLRAEFDDDLDALNRAFGLAYWSNRVDAWEDFPDVRGTINGSLGAAFDRYRRGLVEEYLGWQAGIVRELARPEQFVTHNFDLDWAPGWSYGLQPSVDHFRAARTVDVAGVDVYHPTQSRLTGKEIAFGGDLTRSLKGGANHLVLETQAQGQHGWLPYPGQLRLQAWSHLASGACGVLYWHWHSIHHSFETYWKGLLSHDLESNPTLEEAGVFGAEVERLGSALTGLRKRNRVAVMVSNEALTALRWFALETGFPEAVRPSVTYNDVLRRVYDALFELNVEVDLVPFDAADLGVYAMLVVPVLYSAPEATLAALRAYVEGGGHLVATFRTGVADEHLQVWHDRAPHALTDVFGASYQQFSTPDGARLAFTGAFADLAAGGTVAGTAGDEATPAAEAVLELLQPDEGTEVLATYDHPAWSGYAAITRNAVGGGTATYLATLTDPVTTRAVLGRLVRDAGLWGWPQDLAATAPSVAVRRGTSGRGRELTYLLNYAGRSVTLPAPVAGTSLLDGRAVGTGDELVLGAWDLVVLES